MPEYDELSATPTTRSHSPPYNLTVKNVLEAKSALSTTNSQLHLATGSRGFHYLSECDLYLAVRASGFEGATTAVRKASQQDTRAEPAVGYWVEKQHVRNGNSHQDLDLQQDQTRRVSTPNRSETST